MSKGTDIVLDIKDYQCLVRGGVVFINQENSDGRINLILSSLVNHTQMREAINKAESREDEYKPHEKTIDNKKPA